MTHPLDLAACVSERDVASAWEDVEPHLGMSPPELWACFVDLIQAQERILEAVPIEVRREREQRLAQLDAPGRWWERVPQTGPTP